MDNHSVFLMAKMGKIIFNIYDYNRPIFCTENQIIFTTEYFCDMLRLTYKECARDKLVDHTATCNM